MIIEIEDYKGNTLGAIKIEENNKKGELEIHETTKDISIADIDIDNIFNTNDSKLRIQLNKINNNELIANKIIDDIITVNGGQELIYNDELEYTFINDYFENDIQDILYIIDEKITKYLDEDNLTIL